MKLNPDRRQFTLGLGSALAVCALPAAPALAQSGAPVEGRDYVVLGAPVSVPSGDKIDVIEFFSYACPHCYAFEPALEAWIKKLPADVAFRRVPAAFNSAWEASAKTYLALEQLGVLDTMHRKVFAHIHQARQRLDKESDALALATANGVDGAKFTDAFRSFGVANKLRLGKQLVEGYKIDGVPAVGVHGRFYTAPSMAREKALDVADFLIQRARKKA
jgi:protein dithiol oxidoreductase (disulfide-forming)